MHECKRLNLLCRNNDDNDDDSDDDENDDDSDDDDSDDGDDDNDPYHKVTILRCTIQTSVTIRQCQIIDKSS